jgi:SAM-dependent methyltransferase
MERAASQAGEWSQGEVYERYVGRWSRLIALQFVQWLGVPAGAAWLDVGCGTGALSQTILETCSPQQIKAIDSSAVYLAFARHRLNDARVHLETADAQDLPVKSGACGAAVSGLVLNFVPHPEKMVAEMKRTVCPGGTLALYVWDYASKMQLMRHFWNAAAALDPTARALDEGRRFPICNPDSLRALLVEAGLDGIDVLPIDIETCFRDFDEYWKPFEGAQGPASAYAMSLSAEARGRLRGRLRDALPFAVDGSIPLVARAWAIRATNPPS